MRKGRKLLLSGILMFLTGIILLTTPFWSQIYFNRVPDGTLYFREETRQILTPGDAAIKKLKSTARLKVFALKNLKSGDIISLNLSLPQLFPQYRIYKGSVIMIPVDYSGREIDVTLLNDKGDLLYQKKMDLFYDQKEAVATTINQDSEIIINISSNDRITQYITPIKISVIRDSKEALTYLEEIIRYTYLLPEDVGDWFTPSILFIGIALLIFGYTLIVRALYKIGGVYNPVNPEQDRPPE